MQEAHFNYDVSLSYAHEDDKFVKKVANLLKGKGVNVYYDKHNQVIDWGKDLIAHLDSIYGRQSKFCVVFISKHYKSKSWAQFEHQVLQSRALKGNREKILPFRMDDTKIPGWPDTITYLSNKEYGPERLAEAIFRKISEHADLSVPRANWKEWTQRVFTKTVVKVGATFFTFIGSLLFFTDKLAPVNLVAKRLHEASKRETQYSRCGDGSVSPSVGGGTCSHHGGVDYSFDTTIYLKTTKQCRNEAMRISWWASLER